MGKLGGSIIFLIALIIGLSLGFLCGSIATIYAGITVMEDMIETNGLEVTIDINETTLGDYMFELVEKKLDEMSEEIQLDIISP